MEPQWQWHIFGYIVNADTMIFTWAAMLVVLIMFRLAARKASVEKPRGLQNFVELAFDFVNNYVREDLNDEQANRIFRLLVAELMFLLVVNVFSLMPFPFFHAAAADANTPIGLALIVFVLIHYYGVHYRKVGGHLKSMASPWGLTPLFIMEQFTNPGTLALRLFGNIFAGDILMNLAASVIPTQVSLWFGVAFIISLVLQLGVLGFNTFIAVMQSVIFMVRTLADISQSMRPAGEH